MVRQGELLSEWIKVLYGHFDGFEGELTTPNALLFTRLVARVPHNHLQAYACLRGSSFQVDDLVSMNQSVLTHDLHSGGAGNRTRVLRY